ncbi:MAG: helix-turn-helix domain-containing protein [Acidovorax temperans]|uniref:helix-turn-helix domain-containing protein n=1 Tax=Acidovorax temperans TaxID=80878 RepID=UPI00391B1822
MSSQSQNGISPVELTSLLPSHPLLSVGGENLDGVIVQHYRHPSGSASIAAAPLRDHLLIVNLSGHLLIEDARARGRWERRWAGCGQMSLIPAGTGATRGFKGNSEALLIHIPAQFAQQMALESGLQVGQAELVPRLVVVDEVIERLARLLLATAYESDPGATPMLCALIRALAIHLLRHHSVLSPEKENPPSSMSGGKLQRVVAHMEAHLDQDMPLSSLVELSGLSSSQFTRTFRAAMGKPPHGYLLDLRIERARNLLEKTDLSIIEVGMQCGFAQPTHFATMFRKLVGLSPREWRAARQM